MSDALVTGLVGLGGVALGLVGNAGIEWVKRTASRRDAARERQAAILRELQDVISEFTREWGELIGAIDRGEADMTTLSLESAPSLVAMRFRILVESVTDDALRRDLAQFRSEVITRANDRGGVLRLGAVGGRQNEVLSRIGTVLRRLSA